MALLQTRVPPKRLTAYLPNYLNMKTKKNVLVIDDDEVFIFLTRRLLQSTNMVGDIHVSYSASEAISFLEMIDDNTKMPDIILLDINMPGMSGWDFLQQYQNIVVHLKQRPQLYVVSSSIADNDTERALNSKGVSGYISKPVNVDLLKKILQ